MKIKLSILGKKKPSRVEQLVREHGTALKRYLHGKMNSPEDAEEVVQEAFLRLQGVQDWNRIQNPKAYLYKTAHHIVIEHYKKNAQFAIDSLSGIEDFDVIDPGANLETQLIAQQEMEIISRVITQLPQRCREAFVLKKYRQLSHKDIAAIMDISVKTVEKHLAHGLMCCYRALDEMAVNNIILFPLAQKDAVTTLLKAE